MNAKQLAALGVPAGEPTRLGLEFIARHCGVGGDTSQLPETVAAIVADPAAYLGDTNHLPLTQCLRDQV